MHIKRMKLRCHLKEGKKDRERCFYAGGGRAAGESPVVLDKKGEI